MRMARPRLRRAPRTRPPARRERQREASAGRRAGDAAACDRPSASLGYRSAVCRALTALCILLALATGCGSGGEKRLSKEEYARRADAVCRRYNAATRSLGLPQSMPGLAKVADRSLPHLDRAIRDLRALRPPEDEESTARSWLRQLSLLRGDVVRIRDRARAND